MAVLAIRTYHLSIDDEFDRWSLARGKSRMPGGFEFVRVSGISVRVAIASEDSHIEAIRGYA
jgi:hypothetical protein